MNPFGEQITDETLEEMARYRGKTITQEDRAREATRLIHDKDKNIEALNHVLKLKSNYGDAGTKCYKSYITMKNCSTLCLIYNATGDTLELVEKNDWSGYAYKDEEPPPLSFENGQWLAFFHVEPQPQPRWPSGSEGARVYRGKNINGEVTDFLVAWRTLWSTHRNSAYTRVEKKDYRWIWDHITLSWLETARKITKDRSDEYCASTVSIGGVTSPEFIAILEHNFSPLS